MVGSRTKEQSTSGLFRCFVDVFSINLYTRISIWLSTAVYVWDLIDIFTHTFLSICFRSDSRCDRSVSLRDLLVSFIDWKNVTFRPHIKSGSTYFNYKSTFRVDLMALVDAGYKFLRVDVECNDRISDGGAFEGCSLQQVLSRRSAMFPDAAPCLSDQRPLQYYIIADDAFSLQDNLMKTFSHKDMIHQHRILTIDYRGQEESLRTHLAYWTTACNKDYACDMRSEQHVARRGQHYSIPGLIATHCMTHQLTEKAANLCPQIIKHIAVLNTFAKALKYSPKLCLILKCSKEMYSEDAHKVKQVWA